MGDWDGKGRRAHVSRMMGPLLMHGGQDDWVLRPGSPAVLDLVWPPLFLTPPVCFAYVLILSIHSPPSLPSGAARYPRV